MAYERAEGLAKYSRILIFNKNPKIHIVKQLKKIP
jgi:hypothetical protein